MPESTNMPEALPAPSDDSVLRCHRLEPRNAWGLLESCHQWRTGRWLPSERASLLQLECLGIWSGLKTLHTCAGTGWMSAVLLDLEARLCVTEPDSAMLHSLAGRMPREVPLCRARPLDGWPQAAPFDRICPGEILFVEPVTLLAQLAPQGRMVYWILVPEGLELRLDILEDGRIVRESLALMGMESCPEQLVALARS